MCISDRSAVDARSERIVKLTQLFLVGTSIQTASAQTGTNENEVAVTYVLFCECIRGYAFEDRNKETEALSIFQDSARIIYYWVDGDAANRSKDMQEYAETRIVNNLRKAMRLLGMDSEAITFEAAVKFWKATLQYHLELISCWVREYEDDPPEDLFNAMFLVFDCAVMSLGRDNLSSRGKLEIGNDIVQIGCEFVAASIEQNNARLEAELVDRSEGFKSKMRGKNRYYIGAKALSDTRRFVKLVEGYVGGKSSSAVSRELKLSRQTVSDVFRRLNDRLVEYRLELLGVKSGAPPLEACACYHYFYFLRDGLNGIPEQLAEAYTQVASIATLGSYNPTFSLEDFYKEWDRRPEVAFIESYSRQLRGIPPNTFPGYFILAELSVMIDEHDISLETETGLMNFVLGVLKEYPLAPDSKGKSSHELMSLAMPTFVRHRNVGGVDDELPDHMPLGLADYWKKHGI